MALPLLSRFHTPDIPPIAQGRLIARIPLFLCKPFRGANIPHRLQNMYHLVLIAVSCWKHRGVLEKNRGSLPRCDFHGGIAMTAPARGRGVEEGGMGAAEKGRMDTPRPGCGLGGGYPSLYEMKGVPPVDLSVNSLARSIITGAEHSLRSGLAGEKIPAQVRGKPRKVGSRWDRAIPNSR